MRVARLPSSFVSLLLFYALALTGCDNDPTTVDFDVLPGEHVLSVGETVQLSSVGAPGPVHWSSSNSAVATVVPETGFVSAVSRGETQITAVSGSRHASARVVVRDPPAIVLSQPALDLEAGEGDDTPVQGTVQVTNGGDGDLEGLEVVGIQYAQGQPAQWLGAHVSSPTAPTTLAVEADPSGLAAGTYTAVILVGAPGAMNSPQALTVRFTVLEPARIVFSENDVELIVQQDTEITHTVQVSNGGDLPLEQLQAIVTAGGDWLSVELTSTEAPANLRLRVNTAGVNQGQYAGRVRVISGSPGVEPATLRIRLTVGDGPAIGANPSSVSMGALVGENPQPASVQITNAGGGTLTDLSLGSIQYEAGQPTGWLSAQLSGSSAPTTLSLSANTQGMNSGTYVARVPVISPVASNSPRLIQVTLTLGDQPQMSLSPTSLTFSAPRQGSNPPMQLVNVTNSGGGTLSGLSTHVTYGGGASGWLNLSFSGGSTTAPTSIEVRPQTGSLNVGTYTASVEVRSTTPGVDSRTFTVTFHILRSFAADVWPILSNAGCGGCHSSAQLNLTTEANAYNTLLNNGYVVAGNSSSSLLMCVLDYGASCPNMPPSGQLSSAQRNIVRQWIDQGAHR